MPITDRNKETRNSMSLRPGGGQESNMFVGSNGNQSVQSRRNIHHLNPNPSAQGTNGGQSSK